MLQVIFFNCGKTVALVSTRDIESNQFLFYKQIYTLLKLVERIDNIIPKIIVNLNFAQQFFFFASLFPYPVRVSCRDILYLNAGAHSHGITAE